jgi:hypothetical protein
MLHAQPLIKAQARDYVRETQERLIGAPVLQRLSEQHAKGDVQPLLLAMLDQWRTRLATEQGYGPGNIVSLLRLSRGSLR